jgi:hypothetical protein
MGRVVSDSARVDEPSRSAPARAEALEFVSYLWPEYQYRHDMVWKLAFRITAVAAALMIAPFLTDESVQRVVGYWGLLALPLLAVLVLGGGLFTLESELRRLGLIRNAYRCAQADVLRPYADVQTWESKRERLNFDWRVRIYFAALLLASIVFFLALAGWWLDDLVDQAREAGSISATSY